VSTDPEIHPLDGCVLVRPTGPQLNALSAPALKNAIVDLANRGQLRVILSLSRLDQIDSSGLGALISLHKTLAPPRGRLVLCEMPAKLQPIFQLTRLDRIFTVAADVAIATDLARSG